jgi:hypothetical protein
MAEGLNKIPVPTSKQVDEQYEKALAQVRADRDFAANNPQYETKKGTNTPPAESTVLEGDPYAVPVAPETQILTPEEIAAREADTDAEIAARLAAIREKATAMKETPAQVAIETPTQAAATEYFMDSESNRAALDRDASGARLVTRTAFDENKAAALADELLGGRKTPTYGEDTAAKIEAANKFKAQAKNADRFVKPVEEPKKSLWSRLTGG